MNPAYKLSVSGGIWIALWITLSLAFGAAIVTLAAAAGAAGSADAARIPALIAGLLAVGTIAVLAVYRCLRSIFTRTAVLRPGGYRQPLRLTVSVQTLAPELALAAVTTAATLGLALAYWFPYLIHRIAGTAAVEPGSRPVTDDDTAQPPPAATRIDSVLVPAELLVRAGIIAGIVAAGAAGIVWLVADPAAVLEDGATAAPEDVLDTAILGLLAVTVWLSIATFAFTRYLGSFAIKRLRILPAGGAPVSLTLRPRHPARTILQYAGWTALLLVTTGGFGMLAFGYSVYAALQLVRNTHGLTPDAGP